MVRNARGSGESAGVAELTMQRFSYSSRRSAISAYQLTEPRVRLRVELRVARLRHFENQAKKADIDAMPSVVAHITSPHFKAASKVNSVTRDIMGMKVIEVEYIDLTSD
jgi:hypothetical protein